MSINQPSFNGLRTYYQNDKPLYVGDQATTPEQDKAILENAFDVLRWAELKNKLITENTGDVFTVKVTGKAFEKAPLEVTYDAHQDGFTIRENQETKTITTESVSLGTDVKNFFRFWTGNWSAIQSSDWKIDSKPFNKGTERETFISTADVENNAEAQKPFDKLKSFMLQSFGIE